MNNINAISVTKINLALQQLLALYQTEHAESQQANDAQFMQYWECACQTIYDVAAALTIPLEGGQPSTQRPRTPDSLTPLGYDDVQHHSNGLSERRQYDAS